MCLKLNAQILAKLLNLPEYRNNPTTLRIDASFQMRCRAVELILHLGVAPPEIDPVIVQNIVKAKDWLAMIINGKSFAEIVEIAGASKRRVQSVVELALLAPEMLSKIATGEQPAALTSDYLIKTGFSAIWAEQRDQFANL